MNFLPALRSLREAYPDALICCTVGSTQVRDLLATQVQIDEWMLFGNRLTGQREILVGRTLPQESLWAILRLLIRLRRRRFDLVVGAYVSTPRTLLWTRRLLGARWVIGQCDDRRYQKAFSRYSVSRPGAHSLEQNEAILGTAGIRVDYIRPALRIDTSDDVAIVAWLLQHDLIAQPFAVVHATAARSRENKRWPAAHFGSLCDIVWREFGLRPILIGAAEELEQIEDVRGYAHVPVVVAAGDLSLRLTAALIARAALHVGNDSGLLHVAAALDRPTVGIFGPTDAVTFGPFTDRGAVASRNLPCSPCSLILPLGCGNPICLTELHPQHVASVIHRLLVAPSRDLDSSRTPWQAG